MTTESKGQYLKIKLGVTVSQATATRLMKLGVPVQNRNEAKLHERHARDSQAVGINPFRLGREVQGEVVPDSGNAVFGKSGIPNVSLELILGDILAAGYGLPSPSLYQNDRDVPKGRYTLQLWMSPGEENIAMSDKLVAAISEQLAQAHHLTVWDNRGSYETGTVNAGVGIPVNAATAKVRMSADGTFTLQFAVQPTEA